MKPPRFSLNRSAGPGVALVVALAAIYLITYTGRILSGDELYLFNATGSLTRYNDFLLDVTAGVRPPQTFETISRYPLPSVDVEPLQVLLSTPLYGLALRVPGIGLVHTVWLFNVIVCALAGGVLYAYARTLGYSERAAALGALALGLGTIVWPYSKTFFREPLAMLMLLVAGLCAQHWRQSHYRGLGWAAGMIAAVVGMTLTKSTMVLALPALFLIALPPLREINRRVLIGLVAALAIVAGLFVVLALFGDQLGVGRRYNPVARFIEESRDYLGIALHSYLLSIGSSIWGTSPVGLLALPGFWLLYKQRRARYIGVVLLVVLTFALGYAASSGRFWFGGLSWPPRFLIPAVPFLVIGALPVFERLTQRAPRGLWALVILVLAYSVWIQLSAVTLRWDVYPRGFPPEARGLLEWGGGLNVVQYLRWVIIPSLWSQYDVDFAWTRAGLNGWPLAFGALALVSLIVASRRRLAWTLPVALLVMILIGLRTLYGDPYFLPDNRPGLPPMLAQIDALTTPDDVLMLSSREYENFFLNYDKRDSARVVGLGAQQGDQPSEEQPGRIQHPNVNILLNKASIGLIHSLAATRDSLWLLENKGPDFVWALRPVEHFMAQHYYPIRVVQTDPPDPTVRLLEYSTARAPDPYTFLGPDILTDLVFGDDLRLAGYTLPNGETYAPGDALPVSFSWEAARPLERDYRIAWFLRTADGSPVAQGWDSRPGGDFEQTSTWFPGAPFWDNRALWLPSDLPPGDYRLWVKVYWLDETFTPRDLPVTGADMLDGVIGILPTVIQVR